MTDTKKSGFWHGLAKVLTQVAIYCAGHPDQIIAIVNEVKTVK